ncbi:electron transfer flavoprotein-ubiquinone oxidoreductase [Cellvibrio polysaccharolyticus]|uniref:Electron transfer flavoprotein-ubiquinone oxidoreductase n=1 Tax=Cellvibrio polysaccharolyticus TaxID=2082724 RepID=A0A928V170_9GAMM|nr:electron transfer flavoprotein-ubiquinone oxidoreductase [Cellvibrio polysaccharolyticus]MBE8716422.1 electron transfer flavoprotein-ubiquinone oxidoreductase [Cellvibrio polysaccharolyticus]
MQRDSMHYDVVIVGAGPSGLAAAIRLKQLAEAEQREINVCVLEKASAVGTHILSGAIVDPIALNELLPDWKNQGLPFHSEVKEDRFFWLTENGKVSIPHVLLPPLMKNSEAYVVSLGQVCEWLGAQAEALGVEIYPGFAAAEILYDEQGRVKGVATGDMGVGKNGEPKPEYTQGMELHANYTLFAEGVRGSLTRQLEERFELRKDAQDPHYGLGFKELWRIKPAKYRKGHISHTLGWPLDNQTGGGGFIYHQGENEVAIGFVVHLNYKNPHLSLFDEFQRFKTHPLVRDLLEGGERLSYGARAISEGGIQSLPKLTFPGGALIGCAAGMVNVPRIKGSHNAVKSGMLAAEAAFAALGEERANDELVRYSEQLKKSWVWQDLDKVRNVKPALSRYGTLAGMAYAGFELWLGSFGVRLPWTLPHGKADHDSLVPASEAKAITYAKPDGVLTFDRLSSIALSNISHEDDQPNHLTLKDASIPVAYNLPIFAAPEQRYCPAGVYEIIQDHGQPKLLINSQNCIHCKTCDIKDPKQNIVWVTPEGGSGPCYIGM